MKPDETEAIWRMLYAQSLLVGSIATFTGVPYENLKRFTDSVQESYELFYGLGESSSEK